MYGEGRNFRYIIGFGLVIVLLFVVIFMIIHSGSNGSKAKVPATQQTLTSYADQENVTVTETVVGPITAAQTHDEVQINVSNSQTTIDVIRGYDGNVINSQKYPMTPASFGEFLNALDKAKFTSGNTDKDLASDEGYCSTGQRYIYEIHQGAKQIQRFWTTSCGGTKTYKGNLSLTLSLFQAQVPDYSKLTSDSSFNNSLLGL